MTLAAAIAANDMPAALAAALAAWRTQRSAAHADLVDAIAGRVRAPKVPRTGIQLAWHEVKPKDHVALCTLLPVLTRGVPVRDAIKPWRDNASRTRLQAWRTRLARLAKFAHDPRIAAALVAFVRAAPFEMGDPYTGTWLYEPALDLIAQTADIRGVDDLRDLAARPTAKTQNLRAFLATALPDVIATIEAHPRAEPTPDIVALVTQLGGARSPKLVAPVSSADVEALVAAVLAEPEADAPREVLGDYWLERGDPRGELIALQLKREPAAADLVRVKQLVRDDRWLGDELRRVTKNRGYRRGMLDEITLVGSSAADAGTWQRAGGDPALATVRHVRRGDASEAIYARLVTSAALRSLREVEIGRGFGALTRGATADQIEHVVLDAKPDINKLAELAKLRALRRLTFVIDGILLRSTADLVAKWPERARLAEVSARISLIFGFKREVVAWLKSVDRLGVPAVSLESEWHPDVIRFVYRPGAELEVSGGRTLSQIDDIIALFGKRTHVTRR